MVHNLNKNIINIPKIQYLFLPVYPPPPCFNIAYYEDTKLFFIVHRFLSKSCFTCIARKRLQSMWSMKKEGSLSCQTCCLESSPKERSIFKNGVMQENFFVLMNQRLSLIETVICKFSLDWTCSIYYQNLHTPPYQITNAQQTVR